MSFSVDNRTPFSLHPLESGYQSFAADPCGPPPRPDLCVTYELAECLGMDGLRKLYELTPSFPVFLDSRKRLVVPNRLTGNAPLIWLAEFLRESGDIQVLIERRRAAAPSADRLVVNPLTGGLDQILLMYHLASHEGGLFHGAGTILEGKGALFCGRSGVGKSTLSLLLCERMAQEHGRHAAEGTSGNDECDPRQITLLSDERVAIRKRGKEWLIHGTPWHSSAGIAVNQNAPFRGLFFLHHGESNRVVELSKGQVLERLLPVVTIPWGDPVALPRLLDICEALLTQVPAFDFHFTPSAEAVDFIMAFMADRV